MSSRMSFALILIVTSVLPNLSMTLQTDYEMSMLFNISAHLKASGLLNGDLSDAERAYLEHSRYNGPIFLEVAAPRGSSRHAIESTIMEKYIPGQPAYRLTLEDRVIKDDAYKSRLLNVVPKSLETESAVCKYHPHCIERWIANQGALNGSLFKDLEYFFVDSADEGCIQLGGCREEVMQTFNYHAQHSDNIIFESTGKELKQMQSRVGIIGARGGYKSKALVIVAMNHDDVQQRYSTIAGTNIYNFLQDPKENAAPVLEDPSRLREYASDFQCMMQEVLDCLSGESTEIFEDDATRPCEPMPDGMFVFDNTQEDGANNVAIAMKGGNKDDTGFRNARRILQKTVPFEQQRCQRKLKKTSHW